MGEDLVQEPDSRPATDRGDRRLGDYLIIREAGRGAMAVVFEAVQVSLGRRVALKILPGNFALDPRRVERFRREAHAAAQIHHPSIIPVYEVGEAQGTHYYTMEFVEGTSLDRVVEQARLEAAGQPRRRASSSASDAGSLAQRLSRFAQLCDGLEEAHRRGLIHRDVKPSNILVDAGGRMILVDFGLVHDEAAGSLTASGELVGTLSYMSPEQVSRSGVDSRSDVFGLGVTLYELITLHHPFQRETEHEIQRAILFEDPLPPRRIQPRVHRDLETILLHALDKNPLRRYPSAAELAADLRRFLRYEPIRARPYSVLETARRRAWKHRGRILVAGVIVLALLALGLLGRQHLMHTRELKLADYRDRVVSAFLKMQRPREDPRTEPQAPAPAVQPEDGSIQSLSIPAAHAEVLSDPLQVAVDELGEAIRLIPDRPDAYYHRGRARALLGRSELALEDYSQALKFDPRFAPAVTARRALLKRRGAEAEAAPLPSMGESSRATADWADIWEDALQALDENRPAEAEDALTRLIALLSAGEDFYLGASAQIRIHRGNLRYSLEDLDGAIEDYSAAGALWPELSEPVLLLGKSYLKASNPQRAEQVFQEFLARAREPEAFAVEVARLYRLGGGAEKALQWLEGAEPTLRRELVRGQCLLDLDRIEEAEGAAKAALAIDPRSAEAHILRGLILRNQGNVQGMEEEYRNAAALNPRNGAAHLHLGNALMERQQTAEAIEQYQKLLSMEPRSVTVLNRLAISYEMQKKYEAAIECYRKAIAQEPTVTEFRANMAVALIRQGFLEEAFQNYLEVIKAEPSVFTREGLKFLFENVKTSAEDPGPWLKRMEEVLRVLGRKDAQLLSLQTDLLVETGSLKEAILVLEEAARLPWPGERILQNLQGLRREILPDIASFASADAILPTLASGSEEEKLFAARWLSPEDPAPRSLALYVRGSMLERAGSHADAASTFLELALLEGQSPEVLLRLASNLRAQALFSQAETWLAGGQRRLGAAGDPLLDLWIEVSLGDLGRRPAELLSFLGGPTASTSPNEGLVRWSLEKLASRKLERLPPEFFQTDGYSSISGRLYALALGMEAPGLWTNLREAVTFRWLTKSERLGAVSGGEEEVLPPQGALLVGLNLFLGIRDHEVAVTGIQSTFLSQGGWVDGQPVGTLQGECITLLAPPGCALAAISAAAKGRLRDLSVSFSKVTSEGLEPSEAVESPIENNDSRRKYLRYDGGLPVGIVLGPSGSCRSLGLIFAKPVVSDYASLDHALTDPVPLVSRQATWRRFHGDESPPAGWRTSSFDDASWTGAIEPAATKVEMRCAFEVAAPDSFRRLRLEVDSDLDFTAYLNGAEVARSSVLDLEDWVPFEAESGEGGAGLMELAITPDPSLLRRGANVLALEGRRPTAGTRAPRLRATLHGDLIPRKALEGPHFVLWRAQAADWGMQSRLHYMEGSVLEAEGRREEARRVMEEVLAQDDRRPEPFLRLARLQRALGESSQAAATLERALRGRVVPGETLWPEWIEICSEDLRRSAQELLRSMPLPPEGSRSRMPALLAGMLERGEVRINCGGDEFRDPTGRVWSSDIYFQGGSVSSNAESALPLYQTERWFSPRPGAPAGYRIPLAPGLYAVTLHFAETYFHGFDLRVFHVLLEGTPALTCYEPYQAGFAVGDQRRFVVSVVDGRLDIEFLRGAQNPQISGIEIERAAQGSMTLNADIADDECSKDLEQFSTSDRWSTLGERLERRGRTQEASLAFDRAATILEGLIDKGDRVPPRRQSIYRRHLKDVERHPSDLPGRAPLAPDPLLPRFGPEPGGAPATLEVAPFPGDGEGILHRATRWQVRREGVEPTPVLDLVSRQSLESLTLAADRLEPRTDYSFRAAFIGSNRKRGPFSPWEPFRSGDLPVKHESLDLAPLLKYDLVLNEGDDKDDPDVAGGFCFVEDGYPRLSGRPIRGLPRDRRVGIHRLADYSGPNVLVLGPTDREPLRLETPHGKFSSLRFLVSGGNGDSEMPILLEYSGGGTGTGVLPCDDWFHDDPDGPGQPFDPAGGLSEGIMAVLNDMDWSHGSQPAEANDPALFEVEVKTDPAAELIAVTLLPGQARYSDPGTLFKLLAATAVAAR